MRLDFDPSLICPTARKRFRPYTNMLPGFSKAMLLEVEEFEDVERRHLRGERLKLDEDAKSRLVRTVRCVTNVYFAIAPDTMLIKIGQAKDVDKRISALRSSSPCEIRLLTKVRAYGDLEFFLHKHLAQSRAHGEWFRPDEKVLAAVEGAIDGGVRGILKALQIDIEDL